MSLNDGEQGRSRIQSKMPRKSDNVAKTQTTKNRANAFDQLKFKVGFQHCNIGAIEKFKRQMIVQLR